MGDAWRLAVGTLTALKVRPPSSVADPVPGRAVLLAPLAVLPLGVAVVLVGLLGQALDLPHLATAFAALGVLALGTRVLHWDGLSDTVDGLTASYDPERSLAVMRSGTSGPAGVVATVVVAGLQVSGLAALLDTPGGACLAGLAVCASRASLAVACLHGVPAARREGLGNPLAGRVPLRWAVLTWAAVAVAVALTLAAVVVDVSWWRGLLAALAALAVVSVLVRHAVRRLGGVTGDVFGACVELSLAALLVVLA
ncbi:adenosylcobinamide-GDP ribazoletransferase [Nocardioides houyundeii]|uniref:adenosylcobinamide-GDP ribazoletransferase n=1 Tax=Nocardioides houyundeii TaxID=2045452 RepID=UPI000DF21510|nr:adenosylcobinamide-GDP ribazoletransferase [Nocardioides houyundeii]